MRYCGIDPSTTSTGIAIFEDEKIMFYGCIKPKSKDWEERLIDLSIELNNILSLYKPEIVYIENPPLKDGKPTLLKLANVQGVIRAVCALNKISLTLLAVSEWRKNAGFFDGDKKGLTREAMKIKAKEEVNKLFNLQVNDDIAEGILIGYRTVYPLIKNKKKVFKKTQNHS